MWEAWEYGGRIQSGHANVDSYFLRYTAESVKMGAQVFLVTNDHLLDHIASGEVEKGLVDAVRVGFAIAGSHRELFLCPGFTTWAANSEPKEKKTQGGLPWRTPRRGRRVEDSRIRVRASFPAAPGSLLSICQATGVPILP